MIKFTPQLFYRFQRDIDASTAAIKPPTAGAGFEPRSYALCGNATSTLRVATLAQPPTSPVSQKAEKMLTSSGLL